MIGPVIIILTWASLCDWDSLGRADSERRAENNFSSIIIRQRVFCVIGEEPRSGKLSFIAGWGGIGGIFMIFQSPE